MQKKQNMVVFYGAGNYAVTVFDILYKKYKPVVYGDNDTKKHGTHFMGLPVLSFEDINIQYPNCQFYVTVNEPVKFGVITSLIDKGVECERIINFEESKRYKSCRFLETYMLHLQQDLFYCCSDFGKNHSPVIYKHGNTYEQIMHSFFSMRDKIIDTLSTPNDSSKIDKNPCLGCPEVKDGLWSTDRRIRQINFNYRSFCNFKCVYCTTRLGKIDSSFYTEVEDALGFLNFLKEKNYISVDTIIENASGEILTHPLRDKILAAVQNNPCWFYTNACIYNKKIAKILSKGKSKIIPSIDAGTRETFKKVKGVDLFDKVCENLIQYAKDGFVELKYIILPGLNDNERDINGLIDICQRAKIKCMNISRNLHDMNAFSEHTLNMIILILKNTRNLGINVSIPDWIFTGTSDKQRVEERLADALL